LEPLPRLDGTTPLPTNVPVHIAATRNASTGAMLLFVNGVQQGDTGTFTGPIGTSTEDLMLGGAQLDSQAFVGDIGDAGLYPCDLSAAAILAIWDSEAP
jgi:hypothetical protein